MSTYIHIYIHIDICRYFSILHVRYTYTYYIYICVRKHLRDPAQSLARLSAAAGMFRKDTRALEIFELGLSTGVLAFRD